MTAPSNHCLQDSLRQLAAMSGKRKDALLICGLLFVAIRALIMIGWWENALHCPVIALGEPPIECSTAHSQIPWQPHP